jgi:hypothetical protein
MRVLIYIFLAYIAYRIIRSLIRPKEEQISPGEVIDEMVKCSSCETYIPRREAIQKAGEEGAPLNFCSEACAEKYVWLKRRSEKDSPR